MDSSAVGFGLLLLLCHCEGQSNPGNSSVTKLPAVTNANLGNTTHTPVPVTSVGSHVSNSSNTALLSNVTSTFSHKCSAFPPLCCDGHNNSCHRGCFCDEACLRLGDCCPDYNTTCPTVKRVIIQLKVSLLAPSGIGDQEVEAALYNASLTLEAYLKNKLPIDSLRLLRIIKP